MPEGICRKKVAERRGVIRPIATPAKSPATLNSVCFRQSGDVLRLIRDA